MFVNQDNVVQVLYYTTSSWNQPLNGIIEVQVSEVTSGLCGCNLKEKLKCSNGIHEGKNWHRIRISRRGERQKICRIVEMKISGNILSLQKHPFLLALCRWGRFARRRRARRNGCFRRLKYSLLRRTCRLVLSMKRMPSKLGHDWWNETLTRDNIYM